MSDSRTNAVRTEGMKYLPKYSVGPSPRPWIPVMTRQTGLVHLPQLKGQRSGQNPLPRQKGGHTPRSPHLTPGPHEVPIPSSLPQRSDNGGHNCPPKSHTALVSPARSSHFCRATRCPLPSGGRLGLSTMGTSHWPRGFQQQHPLLWWSPGQGAGLSLKVVGGTERRAHRATPAGAGVPEAGIPGLHLPRARPRRPCPTAPGPAQDAAGAL